MSPVDWCPNCNTTLAREQVWGDDRHCERCETPVIKKDLEQWFFRTTRMQKNCWISRTWIGRNASGPCKRTGSGDQKALRFILAFKTSLRQVSASERGPPDRLHHPPGYPVGRYIHGAGAGTSAGARPHFD
jgi:hypothetical protein